MDIFIAMFFQVLILLPITCIQTFFYSKTIGLNPRWKGLRLAFAMLFVTVIEAASQFISGQVAALSWIGFLLLVMYILYPVFFMGGKLRERILFGVINSLAFLFSIFFAGMAVFSESHVQLDLSGPSALPFFAFIIGTYAVYAILALIITLLNTEGKRYMPRKYWTGVIICFSIILIVFFTTECIIAWVAVPEMFRMYTVINSLVILIIWLLLYFVFSFICRYFAKATEANTLLIQNDMIERYMLRKQASDERIKVLSHDLKHSLIQWRTLAKEKGDTNALQSIAEYEEQLASSSLVNVENESANAIINQKCLEAKQERVEFLVDGVFHKDLIISKLDLCSLLGNLLDNAIEAAAQAETETLRHVKLSIRRKGNLLVLAVENGYAATPVIENGSFVTRKKDKERHALGMQSIGYVSEKYGGVFHNSFENNWFKATVMLRGYQNALSYKN